MHADREYAKALFMLAAEEGATQEYLQALFLIKQLITENPDYVEFLASPAIPLEERLQAVDEAFDGSLPENVLSFLKLMCEHSRIKALPGSIEEFLLLAMELGNRTTATVYSAVELNDKQKQGICAKLEKLTGKTVEPVFIVDETLIGGIKIETEGKTYDSSIRHRLDEVKEVIIR